jgi:hypothetical protein
MGIGIHARSALIRGIRVKRQNVVDGMICRSCLYRMSSSRRMGGLIRVVVVRTLISCLMDSITLIAFKVTGSCQKRLLVHARDYDIKVIAALGD